MHDNQRHVVLLQMLAELAISLRDDLRPHMPELLPRLVALFVEAERTGNFEMVKPGLEALEVGARCLICVCYPHGLCTAHPLAPIKITMFCLSTGLVRGPNCCCLP